jgi:hypothetical protein
MRYSALPTGGRLLAGPPAATCEGPRLQRLVARQRLCLSSRMSGADPDSPASAPFQAADQDLIAPVPGQAQIPCQLLPAQRWHLRRTRYFRAAPNSATPMTDAFGPWLPISPPAGPAATDDHELLKDFAGVLQQTAGFLTRHNRDVVAVAVRLRQGQLVRCPP